jgi:hypothetical protein
LHGWIAQQRMQQRTRVTHAHAAQACCGRSPDARIFIAARMGERSDGTGFAEFTSAARCKCTHMASRTVASLCQEG